MHLKAQVKRKVTTRPKLPTLHKRARSVAAPNSVSQR